MYIQTIQDIEIPFLHDAALTLSLRKDALGNPLYNLRSIYMDPHGECAISYYGFLPIEQIKEIMINYCYPGENKSYDEIHPVVWKNYEYIKGNSSEGNPDFTTIYTPDNLDYRTL